MDAFEQAVADQLNRKGWEVFVPHKDKGIDFVALPSLRQAKAVRIQVKGSRTYGPRFQAWYKFPWNKWREAQRITDFWVFVCFVSSAKGRFRPQFVVVPSGELTNRLGTYKPPGDPINFYLTEHRLGGERHLIDDRDLPRKKVSSGDVKARAVQDYSHFWSESVDDVWRQLQAVGVKH